MHEQGRLTLQIRIAYCGLCMRPPRPWWLRIAETSRLLLLCLHYMMSSRGRLLGLTAETTVNRPGPLSSLPVPLLNTRRLGIGRLWP